MNNLFNRALRTSPYVELFRAYDEGCFQTLVLLEKAGDVNDCKIMQYGERGETEMELYYNDAQNAYWDYLEAVAEQELHMVEAPQQQKTA